MSAGVIRCPRCSAEWPGSARFCPNCGTSLVPDDAGVTTAMPAIDDLQRLLEAETAGTYAIRRELGRGGMGAVYLATELALGRDVALKVLPPEFAFAGDAAERFRREARTAASLDHPHIVPIFRVSERGRLLWYAMKYIEGADLSEWMNGRDALSAQEAARLLALVADALDYAHGRGIVHRDLKPQNVMLDRRGVPTITDFGLAKATEGTKLTGTGSVVGTPHYMAPEQWAGGTLTGATDQYAFGVMAFQLLSGRLPFEGDSIGSLIHAHMHVAPPLERLPSSAPDHVLAALGRAMSKDPAQRFASVSLFVAELAGTATSASVPRPVDVPSPMAPMTDATPAGPVAPPAQRARPAHTKAAATASTPWQAARAAASASQTGRSGARRDLALLIGGIAFAAMVSIGLLLQVLSRPTPVQRFESPPPPVEPPRGTSELTRQPRALAGQCTQIGRGVTISGIRGSVTVEVVVDTAGRVEPTTARIISSAHPSLDGPAIDAAVNCLYRPGMVGDTAVRALAQREFHFNR
jgi:TonB family protein